MMQLHHQPIAVLLGVGRLRVKESPRMVSENIVRWVYVRTSYLVAKSLWNARQTSNISIFYILAWNFGIIPASKRISPDHKISSEKQFCGSTTGFCHICRTLHIGTEATEAWARDHQHHNLWRRYGEALGDVSKNGMML